MWWEKKKKLEKTYHWVTEVFGGVVRNVQQFAILRHHHEKATESLCWKKQKGVCKKCLIKVHF